MADSQSLPTLIFSQEGREEGDTGAQQYTTLQGMRNNTEKTSSAFLGILPHNEKAKIAFNLLVDKEHELVKHHLRYIR